MRADFYLIQQPRFRQNPELLVCKLVEKALLAKLPLLILVETQSQAENMDDWLWGYEEDAFIPHQIVGHDDDVQVPVLIASADQKVPSRPLVINLRKQPVTLSCERVLEVVPADMDARKGSRERWRYYKQQGAKLTKYDM